jgi:Calx-beta domain/Fibronectin type III domain
MRSVVRRERLGPIVVVALLAAVLGVAAAGPAVAQTQTRTFVGVQCTAVVNGSTVNQTQDVTISISAPDSVAPGSSFTVTFPGGTAMLPTQSNGLTITSYANIFLTYQMHNATFTAGTIVNPGTATLIPAGSTTPKSIVQKATLPVPDQIKSGQPGPFSPGTAGPNNYATLITPDISVNATAPASGSVTLNALSLTTNVVLNGSINANVTCNIPQDTIITIPVGSTTNTPPTVNAGPDVAGNVSAAIALSGTVSDPDSTPTDTWTINDPACTFAAPTSPSTSVTCTKSGTFTATLTAADGVNPPVSDTAQVVVTQATTLIVNAGGPVSGIVSHAIALSGSVSDPSNSATSSWTVNSAACTFANAAIPATTITCSTTGTFIATLTAQAGGNPPQSDTATVTVNPDIAPTVDAGPDAAGDTGTAVALRGAVTDPDDAPAIHWTASDPRCSFANATQPATTINCSVQGNYTATLTANDGFNPAVADTVPVVVTDILFPFNYIVDATTHLKTLNQDVTVPTGSFTGVIDLTTGALTGDITLPPAAFTFNLAGVGLVTANMQITETQHITGQVDVPTLAVSATAVFDIKILSLHPTATPTVNLVGNSCKTSTPVSVTMLGTANLAGASTFSGVYTIPPLQNCGLLTTALNAVIPGPGNTFTAVVQPPPAPPSVDAQPSDQTVAPGQSYSFDSSASGYPNPTVQWQVSTNGGSTFTNVAGATAPTYSATAALADSGKKFRAVFTNPSGTANSNAATLTVAVAPDAPTIGTATAGASAAIVSFTAPAHNGGSPILDYTAQCTTTDGGVNGSSTGASSPLTVSGITPGAIYTCAVTARNAIGSSAPSSASNAVVPTAPPAITAQPADSSVNAGDDYSFSAAASGSPGPSAQWQVSTDGGSTFANVTGATGNTLSGTAASADSGKKFRAVFTNSTGSATTNAATLTVASVAPQITSQPANQSVVTGNPYTFSAGASGGPAPTVQWQVSTNGGSTFQNIAGATSNTLTGPAVTSDSGKRFRATYTNSAGTATTNAALLTVTYTSTISIASATVMEGDSVKNRSAMLAVTLSQAAGQDLTVHYATVDGTAVAPGDYVAKSGNLVFKAGSTTRYVKIPVKPDTVVEPDKTLQVQLSNPTGGFTLAANHKVATVTILNDDAGSGLTVSAGDAGIYRAANGPLEVARVLVTLSAPAPSTMTVRLALSAGSAASGSDYKPWATKTLTFNAGTFQKLISVSVYPGSSSQASKTALLTLSSPSAGLSIGRTVGTLTIANHD